MGTRSVFAILIVSGLVVAGSDRALASPPADALPPGQVYECTDNGQHVFSDKPCGAHAAIRQLNALNTMPSPATNTQPMGARAPLPARIPTWYSPDDGYVQDYAAQDDQDAAGVSGTPVVYYGGVRRAYPVHPRRPPPHHVQQHAPAPARGSLGR